MLKNIIKIFMMILGNGILVAGIINKIEGIGRFAMILFGVLFSIIGSCMSFEKKANSNLCDKLMKQKKMEPQFCISSMDTTSYKRQK